MTINLAAALPALLPRAILWAEAQATNAWLGGRSLTRVEGDFARHVGVRYPDRSRLKVVGALPLPGDPELQQAAVQAGLLGPRMLGLTLGYAVFVCNGHDTNPRLLRHEFRHVYQYETAGSVRAFLPVYLGQIVQFGYQDAPFEQDARAHEG